MPTCCGFNRRPRCLYKPLLALMVGRWSVIDCIDAVSTYGTEWRNLKFTSASWQGLSPEQVGACMSECVPGLHAHGPVRWARARRHGRNPCFLPDWPKAVSRWILPSWTWKTDPLAGIALEQQAKRKIGSGAARIDDGALLECGMPCVAGERCAAGVVCGQRRKSPGLEAGRGC